MERWQGERTGGAEDGRQRAATGGKGHRQQPARVQPDVGHARAGSAASCCATAATFLVTPISASVGVVACLGGSVWVPPNFGLPFPRVPSAFGMSRRSSPSRVKALVLIV